MKPIYLCPCCQYISTRKWNIERHVRNVHGIQICPKESNVKQKIYQQKKFHTGCECEIQSSECHSTSEHEQTLKQEQKSRKDLLPSVCVCKERKPFIVYNEELINKKNVQFRKELFKKMGAEISFKSAH